MWALYCVQNTSSIVWLLPPFLPSHLGGRLTLERLHIFLELALAKGVEPLYNVYSGRYLIASKLNVISVSAPRN